MASIQHSLSILIVLATVYSAASLITTESLYEVLEKQSYDVETHPREGCHIPPPLNLQIVNRVRDGVTLRFSWTPNRECKGTTLFVTRLLKGENVLISTTVASTERLRGEVYRNLTANTYYKFEAAVLHNNSRSSWASLIFKTDKDQDLPEHLKMVSNKEEQNCEGRITAPTDGAASEIGSRTATVTYKWSQKEGDCLAGYIASVLVRSKGNGETEPEALMVSSPYHVRGQVYTQLSRNNHYTAETVAAKGSIESDKLKTSFKTSGEEI